MQKKETVSPLFLFAFVNIIPDKYDDWIAAYNSLAEYVFTNEPETRTYYFGIPIDYANDHSKTDTILAVEQYGKWDDLYLTHFHSEAMAKFLSMAPNAMASGLDLNHYGYEAGKLDYPGDQTECAIMLDTTIKAKSPESAQVLISKIRKLGKQIEALEKSKKLPILTWLGVSSVDNSMDLRIYARFNKKNDLEAYQRREEVVNFFFESKEQIDKLTNRSYVPNMKGWLHR